MNYLQLCNKVKDIAGIAGPSITDTQAKQPHINKLVCDWVRDAWAEIQSDQRLKGSFLYKKNQSFLIDSVLMPKEFTNQDFKLPDDIAFDFDMFFWTKSLIDGLPSKKLTKRAIDEVNTFIPPEKEPHYVAPTSPNSFFLVPPPKERGILIANYWNQPQILENNNDIPEGLRSQDQMAIVYKALVYYGIYDAAEEIVQYYEIKSREYMERLYHYYHAFTGPKRVKYNKWL